MSELQTENESTPNELITQEVEQPESGTIENGPDLATGEGENPDNTNQEAVNKAINKQHAKYQEERRHREASDRSLAEAQKKLAEYEASKPALSVPAMPDPYDDGFEEKMAQRDAALLAKAKQDAQQSVLANQQQAQQQQIEQRKQADQEKVVGEYSKRATAFGISPEQLQAAAGTVAQNGMKQEVAEFILADPDGPLIIQHLAANPIDQDELNSMNSMQAALAISGSLKAKASALKRKQSNAPDPVQPLNGNGVDPETGKYPHSKGATFS